MGHCGHSKIVRGTVFERSSFSDFSAGERDIAKGKAAETREGPVDLRSAEQMSVANCLGSEDEKSESKPPPGSPKTHRFWGGTSHQNRFFNHERYRTAYLAPVGYSQPLQRELQGTLAQIGPRLFIAEGPAQKVRFAQNIWHDLEEFSFRSIGEAADKLRSLQGLWAYYPHASVRRGALIQERLPRFFPKPLVFPSALPTAPLGSWTLLDEGTLLFAKRCSSPFAHGEIHFVETKEPPSRAYLKLWEFFLRTGKMPKPGSKCLEIGASPGGWTWVLSRLGAQVTAVDRAPLAPSLQDVPFLKKDAFSLKPEDFPDVEWIFSDVVSTPKKLLEWVQPWLDMDVQLVCTLKFQGDEDIEALDAFEKIGELIRLFHNKHELTWFRVK